MSTLSNVCMKCKRTVRCIVSAAVLVFCAYIVRTASKGIRKELLACLYHADVTLEEHADDRISSFFKAP